MNIIQFQKQVYERILSEYFKEVRKEKLSIIDKITFPSIIGALSFISYLSYMYLSKPTLPIFICSFVGFLVSMRFFVLEFKNIFMFKKESDKFFGTTFLKFPVLDNYELKQYFRSTDDFFCKRNPTREEIDNLVKLTDTELKQMENISFDKYQKNKIYKTVKNKEDINFYLLGNIISSSEENLEKIKKQEREEDFINMGRHKNLLDSLGYKDEISNYLEPVKKTKYLL